MKVSFIMCVRNGEKYLNSSIDSILNQTIIDFELIIVANCCNDNSVKIINKYSDHRIKLIESNICQLSFNLNLGIQQAKGKYIARIDADDIANPLRLEKQLNIIEIYDYDVVGSAIDYINENDEYLKTISFPENNKKIRRNILFKSVIAHPAVIIKREVLLSVSGYFGGQYAQDYDLWLRLMRNERVRFYNIQEPLIKYRIHENQTKGNKNSYGEVAGYFLKEVFYTGKIKYLLGSIFYFFKALLIGK